MRYNGPEQDNDPRSETHDTDRDELTVHDTEPAPAPEFEEEARVLSYISNLDAHMAAIRRATTRRAIPRAR